MKKPTKKDWLLETDGVESFLIVWLLYIPIMTVVIVHIINWLIKYGKIEVR